MAQSHTDAFEEESRRQRSRANAAEAERDQLTNRLEGSRQRANDTEALVDDFEQLIEKLAALVSGYFVLKVCEDKIAGLPNDAAEKKTRISPRVRTSTDCALYDLG